VIRGRTERAALLATAAGAALFVLGLLVDPRRALHGYLAAHAFVLSLALGALAFLMTVHAMDATWPVAVRRLVEAAVATLPLLALLFLPVVAGLGELYPWTRPAAELDAALGDAARHRRPWLNVPFFLVRGGVYFAVWSALALLLCRWSLAQDRPGAPAAALRARQRVLAAVGLPPLGLTATFAAVDWLMSMSPTFHSTMFGFYFLAGAYLGGIALTVVLAAAVAGADTAPALGPSHFHALGRLLLAFTVFWGYIAFFQYMLVWAADQPGEARWYLARARGGAGALGVAVAVGQFALPFLALLSWARKRRRAAMVAVALWALAFHWLDVHWLVVPSLGRGGFPLSWVDLAALAAVGGPAVLAGARFLRGRPLVPRRDPALAAALEYRSR